MERAKKSKEEFECQQGKKLVSTRREDNGSCGLTLTSNDENDGSGFGMWWEISLVINIEFSTFIIILLYYPLCKFLLQPLAFRMIIVMATRVMRSEVA